MTEIRGYSLKNPEKPQLISTATQSGNITGSFTADGKLWLMTSDGQCACGYSRLKNRENYIPKITVQGKKQTISDEQIHILGEPTRVSYTAVSVYSFEKEIALEQCEVFYGDAQNIWYGRDYIAISTENTADVYIFNCNKKITYGGKVNIKEVLGDKNSRYELISLSKDGDFFRLIGTEFNNDKTRITAISLTSDFKTVQSAVSNEIEGKADIDEITQDGNGQIVCYSVLNSDYGKTARFGTVIYGEQPKITLTDLSADYISGIDMCYSYGSSYGNINAVIPLGEGVYLRYNGLPDGLEIYDFSDFSHPKRIYKGTKMLKNGERFGLKHFVYEKNTVGFAVLTPGGGSDYRNLTYSFRVYNVDLKSPSPFTLKNEYKIDGCENLEFLKDSENVYCVTNFVQKIG